MVLALSYQYGCKISVTYFQFEQLSIIPVVSLLLTFNKYAASGGTFEKKQTKNEYRKENHRRKTNCFIGKYATSVRFCIAFVNIS